MIPLEEFTKWLNETQRDPRLNEILHPLFTMAGDSEYSIRVQLKKIYDAVGISIKSMEKVKFSCSFWSFFLCSN